MFKWHKLNDNVSGLMTPVVVFCQICTLIMCNCGASPDGFPGGSVAKNAPANAGDLVLIPGSGRSCGEGTGNPLQYSCLENPMDRGAQRVTAHGVTKNQTQTYG